MRKIIISLSVVAAVAAAVVVGTTAFFSDTETSTGNTFTAGTIDIAIDGENPWIKNYSIGDLKPGETGYINFDITNVGKNPVNVSKNLSNWNENTGGATYSCTGVSSNTIMVSSEPECVEAQARGTDENNVQTQILYDLSVKVYADSTATEPIWWQSIYTGATGETLSSIYPAVGTGVALGMIPVGGHMKVTQSYHFNPQARNEYQGDTLSFEMTIKGDQLAQANGYNTVVMENKSGAPDWQILSSDGISGNFQYQTAGAKLNYNLTGTVKTAGTYTLIYVGLSGDYPANGSKFLGQVVSSGTSVTLSGSVNTGSITSGKIWLVPASTYNSGSAADGVFNGWDHANNLYETALINYVQN
jgi:predicted ribosomally synthesized peptide with SipW-like signal peptide